MSDLFLRTAVTAHTLWGRLLARLRDERGQDAIEYVGVLAVVAIIIGVVMAVAGKLQVPILSGTTKEISKVFH